MRTHFISNYLKTCKFFEVCSLASIILISGCTAVSSEYEVKYSQLDINDNLSFERNEYVNIGERGKSHDLMDDPATDLTIKGNSEIITISGNVSVEGRGKVKTCNGYNESCLVIDEYFKLKIPKKLSFDTSETWEWEDFKYESIATRNIVILGKEYRVLEIIGYSPQIEDKVVKMYVHPKVGLIYFSTLLNNYNSSYILQSVHGFWAEIEQ